MSVWAATGRRDDLLWGRCQGSGPTPYLTVVTFQCLNWIEQDYLAPQGLAFLFSLGLLFVVLRWLAPPAPAPVGAAGAGVAGAGHGPGPERPRPSRRRG